MKKYDRNCMMQPYPMMGMIPNQMMPMPMYNEPMYNVNTTQTSSNNTYDDLQKQINMLDRRVSKLEASTTDGTTYNSFSETNYHVM